MSLSSPAGVKEASVSTTTFSGRAASSGAEKKSALRSPQSMVRTESVLGSGDGGGTGINAGTDGDALPHWGQKPLPGVREKPHEVQNGLTTPPRATVADDRFDCRDSD
jgi:hypothetical protein